jgi:hypothetical protein
MRQTGTARRFRWQRTEAQAVRTKFDYDGFDEALTLNEAPRMRNASASISRQDSAGRAAQAAVPAAV